MRPRPDSWIGLSSPFLRLPLFPLGLGMPQGTDVLGSLTFGMLQMPKLNEIPPGRAGRGEGRWPGQTGPEAARLERRAQGQAGGARAPWDSWGNSRLPTHPGPGWSRYPPSLLCAFSFQKSTMESKDEVSDTDSGIILQSGPDSPVSPMKELAHAVHKQQRALEARLEACLEELRRLCLREAELTGTLPVEYPLKPGEKAPKVRRRIGAAYKLDDWALHREDPLSSLERQLALQLQITEAARRLCLEENLSRQARRQRKHSMLQEEKKLQELQRCLVERRRNSEPPPAAALPLGRELSASDDSSLSDGLLLEEEESQVPKPPPESPAPPSRPLPPQTLEGLQPTEPEPGGPERAPVQNSPWKETSLDHPYEKPRKSSEPWSESRVDSFRAGPEGRGRSAFPRRRPTHYTVTVPESCFPATKPPLPHASCHSCSEDSGSDISSISHPTSPGSSSPDISFLQPLSPPKTHRHRGAWGPAGSRELVAHHPKLLLPPGYFPAGRYVVVAESPLPPGEWELCRPAPGPAYEEEGTPLRYQRLVPSRSRIVRTPSLKDSPAGRGLSKAAVSEELKWWHERARLRSTRPHSLDRQGAFRVRSLPLGREGFGRALGPRAQVPTVCVLRRSPDGAPVQVFVPEKGEIISQV
uniref:Innate immunity activator n=1 Tax=Cercocebus atys TaxID=9531 RepID=A0A2K5P7S9_CERAT